ncbi:hypothetical protein L6164_035301 [Bauhinia variegata]|uniref:Uncharacterized protein n=1 Tax=Bauhinia variegata TaxID=167791 RepID=A0ACB9KDJ8_BAUVA|nr:hypothetical protein L6164_035301 [Bauhinia variegata]
MRAHVFSANGCVLRQALPVLFQPRKSFVSRTGSIFLQGSATGRKHPQILIHDNRLPLYDRLFTSTPSRKFTTRAADVNGAGSIDSPLMQSMENKIREHLNAESVTVKDAYGDGRHVSIDVVSTAFEGQSAVNRQRMVYKAIWEELQSTVHAVDQMTTSTPTEAAARNDIKI